MAQLRFSRRLEGTSARITTLPVVSMRRRRPPITAAETSKRRKASRSLVAGDPAVRTGNEPTAAAALKLALDTAMPVSVIAGAARPQTLEDASPRALLYVDVATIDETGILSVHGWSVSAQAVLRVDILAGDERIAEARTGVRREDVAAAFPGHPHALHSGFSLTMRVEETSRTARTIRVRVTASDGFVHEEAVPLTHLQAQDQPSAAVLHDRIQADRHGAGAVAPQGTTPIPAKIEMYSDDAILHSDGMLAVEGWAVCADGIAQVRVLLDDQNVGLATFGYDREDLGQAYPDIAMAHLSGFRFDQRVGEQFEGQHTVTVVVCSARGTEVRKQITVVVTKASAAPAASSIASAGKSKATAKQFKEFQFELDSPVLLNDVMVEPVTGRLTIEGWLLARSGVASFEVQLDEQRLGSVHYGLARQDVAAGFPTWPNALHSGFAFYCPQRSLQDGEHTMRLIVQANNGLEFKRSFRITVKRSAGQGDAVCIRRRLSRGEADMMSGFLAELDYRPSFRFILRQGRSLDRDDVAKTLEALRAQAYADWTVLVLAVDKQAAATTRHIVMEAAPDLVDRFSFVCPQQAGAWTAPLAKVSDGRMAFHALLLFGDEPGADALLELAIAAGRDSGRDLIYGDEVRISPVSKDKEPFFKPDFSPDLLLSTNYIGRLWIGSAALLARTGATPASLAAAGEYDLLLHCTELAAGVHHVPKLLCQRGSADLDKPRQEQAALKSSLARRDIAGKVLATQIPGTWRVRRARPSKGKVSIIIPTCAAEGHIETCLSTLRAKTSYPDYEIICVDNIPHQEMRWKIWLQRHADKVVDQPGAFNWSSFNNRAVEAADGAYLLFLNDDVEILHDDWLDALVEHAQRPEVGIVGAQLLYPDSKIQHAGMFLSTNHIARHAFRFLPGDDPGYFGLALTQRNVIAVTGACMLMRGEVFERLGRFDEKHEIVNNDLDFCLRAHRAGLLTVYTPYASLIHHELASRAGLKDVFDPKHFSSAWKTIFAAGDPYFNPRLSRNADDYRPDDEPVQWVVSGQPLFQTTEIRSILVVKLDHIGDFVTALPSIRRLKMLFPDARITVLAGPASGSLVRLEPCIDEFIPFSFFHAKSQLGERELTEDDYAALAMRLRPCWFDLAVDLRKHLSTREVLRHTGARFLAGYDYLGQFPFLDIALNWDGDRTLQRKRSHIVDDLLALVEVIGQATERRVLLDYPDPPAMKPGDLPASVRRLFSKPVVAVHPGAGTLTRQWPVAHFSALIDLLIEKNDVNVMLVGGPDDVEAVEEILASVLHRGSIASMAGKNALAELPALLKTCALYVGSNSGPKHIAAAVGIPTIGIHSGVVDPVEWGPIGQNAVALRRNMSCSPCYLAHAEDCPRGLACLQSLEPAMVYETANMMLKPIHPTPGKVRTDSAKARKSKPRRRVKETA